MTSFKINDVSQRVQYTATASQTAFTVPFPFFADADITVYQNSTLLVLTTDYTLTGSGTASGGTLTLVTGATVSDIITIYGTLTIDRTSIYSPVISNLTGDGLNNDFNREIVMLKQQETTQDYLQLQYQPYAQVSQDVSVTIDRWLPLLTAGATWKKNAGNTAIETVILPTIPTGTNQNFTVDNRLVKTDTSSNAYTIQQTGMTADDADNITGVASLTLTGTLTASGLIYPTSDGSAGQVIGTDGAGNLTFTNQGDGDVDGPASGTNNAYVRFDGTTGKLIQNSLTTEDDSGNVLFSGTVTLNSDPTSALQAVTKQYADALSSGLEFKDSVVASSTTALTVTYNNGASGVGATLTNAGAMAAFSTDGISPSANDRILIKDQAAATQNGIYTVTTVGDGTTNWVLTRATDHDEPSEMTAGVFVLVDSGTVNGFTGWVQTTTVVTVGTTNVSMSQFNYGTTFPSITVSNLTASRAVVTDGSKQLASSATTATELGYVNGVTSAIQTQLNTKITSSSVDTLTNKTFDANGTGNSLSNVDIADLATGTDGELITWDASGNPATVATGTATHVLTSNGVGAAPTFQAASGGDYILISSATAANSTQVEFTGLSSTYTAYKIVASGIIPVSDDVQLRLLTSDDGGSTYGSSYNRSAFGVDLAGTTYGEGASVSTVGQIGLFATGLKWGNDTGESGNFELTIFDPSQTKFTAIHANFVYVNANGNVISGFNGCNDNRGVAVDAIKFLFSTGNISVGEFRLYGLKNT